MKQAEEFSRLDLAFSRFMAGLSKLDKEKAKQFQSLCAELSFSLSKGHSFLPLTSEQTAIVLDSGLAMQPEQSDRVLKPLVLESNHLYMQRYWDYECRLAQHLQNHFLKQHKTIEPDSFSLLDSYFPDDSNNQQRQAAEHALSNALTIISGGPGTGKTTVVCRILGIMQQAAIEKASQPLRIALAAPTGKSAMQLQQALINNKQALPCSEQIKQALPESVSTIHRLLGSISHSPFFKHNTQKPLPLDVLVVDEASMIDLALMCKLVESLAEGTKLILLGDRQQLTSVELGSVLADLTYALPKQSILFDRSYRFKGDIKDLAELIKQNQADKAWALLNKLDADTVILEDEVIQFSFKQYQPYLKQIRQNAPIESIFAAFQSFKVLASNRRGYQGIQIINQKLEEKIAQEWTGQIHAGWYPGRPIMISRNYPELGLYNGDQGICLFDQESAQLKVFFASHKKQYKKIAISLLPEHEVAYAITVHKSQGSEYDQCLLVLPKEMNPVLSRQLIYTAVTRSRKKFWLYSQRPIFFAAVAEESSRKSGLAAKIKD